MRPTFAAQLNKMITAGLGGNVSAPETGVAVGRLPKYTSIGPAALLEFEANVALPFRALSVDMVPVQDLHGQDAPYPPGGGKNKFDASLMSDASTGAEFITLNLKPNTAYTMSSNDPCRDNGTITDLFFCNMDESVSSGTNGVKLNKSITRTSDANGQLRVGYRCYEDWITPEQLCAYHSQVEEGGTATTWSPYSNICPISGYDEVNIWRDAEHDTTSEPEVTIQFDETVYSGRLDVVSGVLTVDRAMVDMGDLAWYSNGSIPNGYQYAASIADKAVGETNFICSMYAVGTPRTDLGYICGRASTAVVSCNATESTVSAFKTAVTGQAIVYELSNPVSVQLTAQQLTSLLGTNNVWSDGGNVSVEYVADTKAYIAKVIAAALA